MNPTPEQLRDPAWWRKCAPEGATHFAPAEFDFRGVFRKLHDDQWFLYGDTDQCWYKTNLDRTVVNRPMEPPEPTPWRGMQDALPPIGYTQDDCILLINDEQLPFEVVAHAYGYAIVILRAKDGVGMLLTLSARANDFCPIQSERDRAADDFLKITGVHESWHYTLGLIHDAGYRKLMSRSEAYDRAIKSVGATTANDKAVSLILDALGYKE